MLARQVFCHLSHSTSLFFVILSQSHTQKLLEEIAPDTKIRSNYDISTDETCKKFKLEKIYTENSIFLKKFCL
jgi:hypothetical protein